MTDSPPPANIFITGGTGFIGRALIPALTHDGCQVRVLVRAGSRAKLPPDTRIFMGNALASGSFARAIPPSDTLIHLVGTPHPSPARAEEFKRVDLRSIEASVAASREAGVRHLIYVSVAQPAPVMEAYIAARAEGERLIRESGLNATVLRPWYVLGPGHRWPLVLLPLYGLLRQLPGTRDKALRLGMVTLDEMVTALVRSVHTIPTGVRILDVPAIKMLSRI